MRLEPFRRANRTRLEESLERGPVNLVATRDQARRPIQRHRGLPYHLGIPLNYRAFKKHLVVEKIVLP